MVLATGRDIIRAAAVFGSAAGLGGGGGIFGLRSRWYLTLTSFGLGGVGTGGSFTSGAFTSFSLANAAAKAGSGTASFDFAPLTFLFAIVAFPFEQALALNETSPI
jgi:hypothetical protein